VTGGSRQRPSPPSPESALQLHDGQQDEAPRLVIPRPVAVASAHHAAPRTVVIAKRIDSSV